LEVTLVSNNKPICNLPLSQTRQTFPLAKITIRTRTLELAKKKKVSIQSVNKTGIKNSRRYQPGKT
jgi:hypothetical protein